MNDFTEDDVWQRDQRDRILAPWYAKFAAYTFVDQNELYQSKGIDTVLCYEDGHTVTVEEKIVRWPKSGKKYEAYALETRSCTVPGHESPGWMMYSEAQRLNYCFAQEDGSLECHWLDMPKLQEWFWPQERSFNLFQMPTKNKTTGRVVPIALVLAAIPSKTFHVRAA